MVAAMRPSFVRFTRLFDSYISLMDVDYSLSRYVSVKFLRCEGYGYCKFYVLAFNAHVLWYTHGIPAGSRSAEWHSAFGYDFPV
jgi:hypothetical protein